MQNNPQDENIQPVTPVQPVGDTPPTPIVEPSIEPQVPSEPISEPEPVSPLFAAQSAVSETPAPTAFGSGSSESTSTLQPVPTKKSKKGLVVAAVITGVLVLLGGGSAFAYNGWYQNPEKVVTDALINTIGAKTATMTGVVDVKNDDYTMKVSIDSKASDSAAELAVDVEYAAGGETFKLKGAGHFSAEGDLYVKVENVRELVDSYGSQIGINTGHFDTLITKIDGNWIKISNDDLGTVSEEFKESQLCFEKVADDIKADKSLSGEVSDLYKKNSFIVIKESLGSRTINGVGSLGYVVDLDQAKTKSFVSGLASTKVGEKLKECDDQIDFTKFAEDMDTESTAEGEGKVEIWASRFGHELTEVNAKGTSDGTDLSIVINPVFNKEVTLETPTNALTINELKAEIEKAYMDYYTELYSGAQTGAGTQPAFY